MKYLNKKNKILRKSLDLPTIQPNSWKKIWSKCMSYDNRENNKK